MEPRMQCCQCVVTISTPFVRSGAPDYSSWATSMILALHSIIMRIRTKIAGDNDTSEDRDEGTRGRDEAAAVEVGKGVER